MPRSKRVMNVTQITRRISRNLMRMGEDFLSLGRAMRWEAAAPARGAGGGRRARRRTRRMLTARDRARLRVQGEYLGLVRHLSVRRRAQVKDLRSRKGYADAIKLARRLVKKRA